MSESIVEVDQTTKEGYRYKVLFTSMGHRCGYVYIPRSYVFEDMRDTSEFWPQNLITNISDRLHSFQAHGGITFNESLEDVDIDASNNFIYCLGFDCGHSGDKKDEECFEKYFPEEYESIKQIFSGHTSSLFNTGIVRSQLYCVQECVNLIRQLESMRLKK